MNNEELLNALGNLLLNRNKTISLNLAYENFINNAKSKCRTETIIYYQKKWQVLKTILLDLNLLQTSDINKNSYNQIIHILINMKYKNATINKFMDLLKQIMKVNVELEYIPYSPIANIKKLKEEVNEIQIIKNDTIENILKYIESLPNNFINCRNRFIIYLMNDTGVRINELVNIELKNINIENNTIYLSYTKTHEPRLVFLQETTLKALKSYLKWHNGSKYLLLSTKGLKMNRDSLYHFLEQIKKELNITQSITPHKWRHTFATNLVKNNVNLNTIMKVMGHTQYATTKRYLHQEQDEIKNQILSALENKKRKVKTFQITPDSSSIDR